MLFENVIASSNIAIDFNQVKSEIKFHQIYNQGCEIPRLIAIQGTIDYNTVIKSYVKPLYRHPLDSPPELISWSPTVLKIKDYLSLKFNQEFNHCLIQLYRNGNDYIGEHADKTLDIKVDSNIINYSIGTTRIMYLRLKDKISDRKPIKIPLYHNSVFLLDWETNRKYLHGIRPDRRLAIEKLSEEDRIYGGERISFTFRTIHTFINEHNILYGQGALHKCLGSTNDTINTTHENVIIDNDKDDSLKMLKAFSVENSSSNFIWDDLYGNGFNSISFNSTKKLNNNT